MSLNLTAAGLADQKTWEAAGYALPSYDREAMISLSGLPWVISFVIV